MENPNNPSKDPQAPQFAQIRNASSSTSVNAIRYGWRLVENTIEAVRFTFRSSRTKPGDGSESTCSAEGLSVPAGDTQSEMGAGATVKGICQKGGSSSTTTEAAVAAAIKTTGASAEKEVPPPSEESAPETKKVATPAGAATAVNQEPTEATAVVGAATCPDPAVNLFDEHTPPERLENTTTLETRGIILAGGTQQEGADKKDVITAESGGGSIASMHNNATESISSIRSIGSFVCRICHNAEHPERLVSPCLCKGSLMYVHVYCLEHWISTSGKTTCELCQFRYNTVQTLRYTCLQSLRMWYSHSMSRRALQEDCQMFSLLTLVAFGIVGTILVGIQYYVVQERNTMAAITRFWTKGWLLFFLFITFTVYFINVYMIVRGQLAPWYRWWQSAREIKLILETRKTVPPYRRLRKPEATPGTAMSVHLQDAYRNVPITEDEVAVGTVFLNLYVAGENAESDPRRHALLPIPTESDDTPSVGHQNTSTPPPPGMAQTSPQQPPPQLSTSPGEQQERSGQQENHNQAAVSFIDV